MQLASVLAADRDDLVEEAAESLGRAHLRHYEATGMAASRGRLDDLFGLVLECVQRRTLGPICAYASHLAQERFSGGFDIAEVQTAFNVLEETIWRRVIAELPAGDLVEATGVLGTVIGAGKDALARGWVSAATRRHVPSLDLRALFEGVAS